jgi:hypothetical protein
VRKGRDAGGDFKNVRACRSAGQIGCVVAYSSFGETPPADSVFARVRGSKTKQKTMRILCTNPTDLGGGSGTLLPYTATAPFPGTLGVGIRIFLGELPAVDTPWLRPPGRYDAKCTTADGASFLKVDALGGARAPTPTPAPTWGYHLGDMNLAMGNLTSIVAKQAASYSRR